MVGQVDGTVTAINLADMSIIANNERHHTQEVTTIDVSLKYIVTGAVDGSVKVLKVTGGSGTPYVFKDHTAAVTNVIIVEEKDIVITKGFLILCSCFANIIFTFVCREGQENISVQSGWYWHQIG